MHIPFAMNSYQGKQILALVRDGDFAHAGEEDGIDRAMASVPREGAQRILDAGCGRGGTAAYLQSNGWGRATGIDIEPKSIAYARVTYPDVNFACCDIYDVAAHVPGEFDVITLFNVLYALPDQGGALRALASRAKLHARLVLFDYTDLGGYRSAPLIDAGAPFLPSPPPKADLAHILEGGGWRLESVEDLTGDYARWYEALVAKIEAKREGIETLGGTEAYEHVLDRYSGVLAAIQEGRLGGVVAYGVKVS
jgi:SAM-dependent methyltransferase